MTYGVNVLMNTLDMFKVGGNDLIGETHEQLLQDIEQNGFSAICDNGTGKDLQDIYDGEDDTLYEELCNKIDDDISDESKFWLAVVVDVESLKIDKYTLDEDVIGFWVNVKIDLEKLKTLYGL